MPEAVNVFILCLLVAEPGRTWPKMSLSRLVFVGAWFGFDPTDLLVKGVNGIGFISAQLQAEQMLISVLVVFHLLGRAPLKLSMKFILLVCEM